MRGAGSPSSSSSSSRSRSIVDDDARCRKSGTCFHKLRDDLRMRIKLIILRHYLTSYNNSHTLRQKKTKKTTTKKTNNMQI